jgi:hypothetical protein
MTERHGVFGALERWRSTAFLVAAAMFVVDAALLTTVVVGSGTSTPDFSQAFIAAGWTAAFVGLLGVYPGLVDESRWLSRAGAVFAVVGTVVFAVMAVAVVAFATGVVDGDFGTLVPIFLPGVVFGSVLGFLTFSVASLRSAIHSRLVGVLLLLPAISVVVNIATPPNASGRAAITLGIVCGLALTMLAIGYLLRTGRALTADADPAARPASK